MRFSHHIIAGILAMAAVPSGVFGADDLILYSPKAVGSDTVPAGPEEGILVRGITIKKGDTLKKLSKKYRGRSAYFPQILLFNKIENPDLIHAGASLRVPVGKDGGVRRKRKGKAYTVSPKAEAGKATAPAAPVETRPQSVKPRLDVSVQRYQEAVAAFKGGHYSQALAGFDRFLADFPNSPLAADAALYRADSLLNLSKE